MGIVVEGMFECEAIQLYPGRQCGTRGNELAMWIFLVPEIGRSSGISCSIKSPYCEWMAK